jgi:biopolymer transport protein ExbD
MSKFLYLIVACLLVFPGTAASQRGKPKPTPKVVTAPPVEKSNVPFPGYTFDVRIDAKGNIGLQIVSGYEDQHLGNGDLKKALTEYMSMQTPRALAKTVGPNVTVRPDPSLTVKTVFDVARTARVSESSEIAIMTSDGHELCVPVDPKFLKFQEVKPNPLLLVVSLNDDLSIELNGVTYGALSDTSELGVVLKDIFHEREIDGVFREGTYEIEKTVYLKAAPTVKFSELVTLATAVADAGAGPLYLQIDRPPETSVEQRLPITP